MFHITTYSKSGAPSKIDAVFSSLDEAQAWVITNCFKHKTVEDHVPSIRWSADLTGGQISRLKWDRPGHEWGNQHMIYINDDLSTVFIDRSDVDQEVRLDRLHESMF